MKKIISYQRILLVFLFFFLIYYMIIYSEIAFYFASIGLKLWFEKMIPTLLPFMILSTFMIRLEVSDLITSIIKPILYPFFPMSNACLYCIFIGFLCGFPMGAKVISQLYELQKITKKEAQYLLSFCNNIGPIYYITFVLVILGKKPNLYLLFGMYGIPICYGMIVRHFYFKKKALPANSSYTRLQKKEYTSTKIFISLDDAIMDSLNAIAKLGGYMVIFNLMAFIPYLYLKDTFIFRTIYCCLEITGGIIYSKNNELLILICLSFGGLSCIGQTLSIIKKTNLNIKEYIIHKIAICVLSSIYYLLLI